MSERIRPAQKRKRKTHAICFACGWADHPKGVRTFRYPLQRTVWDPTLAEQRGMVKGSGIRTVRLGSVPICQRCIAEAQRMDRQVKENTRAAPRSHKSPTRSATAANPYPDRGRRRGRPSRSAEAAA